MNPKKMFLNGLLGLVAGLGLGLFSPDISSGGDLVSYWKFDEKEGDIALDSAGSNHGKLYNAKHVPGKKGNALDFDGNREGCGVMISHDESLAPESFSICLWVKAGKQKLTAGWGPTIFAKIQHPESIYSGYGLLMTPFPAFSVYGPPPNILQKGKKYCVQAQSSSALEEGVWTHIVCTFDKEYVRIYLNGKLVQENAGGAVAHNKGPLAIGTHSQWGFLNFIGAIDEMKFYRKALAAEEVKACYEDTTIAGETDKPVGAKTNVLESVEFKAIRKSRDEIKVKAEKLEALLRQAKDKGIKTPNQDVSWYIIKMFLEFDEIRNLKPDSGEFYKIAGVEIENLEKMVSASIGETQKILDDPSLAVNVPPIVLEDTNIQIKDGTFYAGNEPVFLFGMTDSFEMSPERSIRLGLNLSCQIQLWPYIQTDWDKFSDRYMNLILDRIHAAEREKRVFTVLPVVGPAPAPFIRKLAPDIWADFNHNVQIDFEHPLTDKYISQLYRMIPRYVASSNLFAYALVGEEYLESSKFSTNTLVRYEAHLKSKYQTLDALSATWGTNFPSFREACVPPRKPDNRARWYDWQRFNAERLTHFYQLQVDGIKATAPKALTMRIPWWSVLAKDPAGVDIEAAFRMCPITSWDGGIGFVDNMTKTRSLEGRGDNADYTGYSLGWQIECIKLDLSKSIVPGNPIFGQEDHSTGSTRYGNPPGSYLRAGLWMRFFHGLAGNAMWYWGRHNDAIITFEAPHLLCHPQVLEALCRTSFDLRRLSKEVIKFPRLERKARILFSESSYIQEIGNYIKNLTKAYEGLYFLDYPVGFLTENQIGAGDLEHCLLLVIPDAKYVKKETFQAIESFVKKGGKVAVIGKDALRFDEYGKKRETGPLLAKCEMIKGTSPREYAVELDRLMDAVGIKRPVRLEDKAGKRVWGVESRTAITESGHKLVYLINLNADPVTVDLKLNDSEGGIDYIQELITNTKITLPLPDPTLVDPTQFLGESRSKLSGISLEPMDVMLLEIYER